MSTLKSPSISKRRIDLDWLRVGAVLLLVPFHAALTFVLDPNSIVYVKDTVNSVFLARMAGFIHQFHMPLLFAISGASTYFALNVRSSGRYLLERVNKLIIPAVFTILVLLPPMTWLTALSHGVETTYWQHFIGFFRLDPSDLSGVNGTFTPAHTWFLLYLAVFSLIALPLFLLERKSRGGKIHEAIETFFSKPFASYLLIIPLALSASLDLLADKNPIYYFGTFCLGYLIMTDERLQKAVDREATISFLLGVVSFVVRVVWSPNFEVWSPSWVAYGLMEQATRVLLVFGILGLAHRFIHKGGMVLNYLAKVSFPFYLLHLPVVTLVGFFIIRLDTAIVLKYLLIVILSILVTFAAVEVLRRIPVIKKLIG